MILRRSLAAVLVSFSLSICGALGQQKQAGPSSPVAPYTPLDARSNPNQTDGKESSPSATDAVPMASDKRPLSGAQELTLGHVPTSHSFLLPSLLYAQILDTNVLGSADAPKRGVLSTMMGRLVLRREWSRYHLNADYAGGGFFSSTNSNLNAAFHRFSLSQTITGRRWTLLFADQIDYSPESSFGFGAFAGLGGSGPGSGGVLGAPPSGLSPAFLPSQTILTGRTMRISNTFVGEVDYVVSPRSSFTISGSYAILHFRDPGLIDSKNAMFRTGYNYDLTKRDSLAIIYGFGMLRFGVVARDIKDHLVQIAYGRRITGRLALQLAAGPQITMFRNDLNGSDKQLFWSAQTSLLYRQRNTNVGLSYLRFVTGGSGVVTGGAATNAVQAMLARQLSRKWSGFLGLGYARNSSLRPTTTLVAGSSYNAWYANAGLSRQVGRYAGLDFSYGLQLQHSDVPLCIARVCGMSLVRHQIGLGFNWSFRPIRID